jgi:flagellar hook-associated protein 1 FlgK
MGTLTALLDLSHNSLEANQAALDITSNNVANANTPGYTDEVAVWQESDSVQLSANARVGEGASVSAVSQRDPVLNQQVNNQTQLEASSASESTALNDLQSIFGITTTSTTAASTTLGTDMNAFFSSLSALEASPSDSSVRQNVLSSATTLATDFNTASSQIAQQTSALNQQVTGAVSEVNSLTSSIASLNLQIEASSPNADAGTLEDQRQQDLTQLSQYIGFSETKTESNGLTLTTANGTPLVSEGQPYALSTSIVNGNVDVIAASGEDITPELNGTVSGITGGSLGGMLQARDQDLPTVSTALDSLAYAVGSAVNAVNENGLDENGDAGGAIFNLPASSTGAASTISVATADPSAIAAASVGEGSSGSTNATALGAIANNPLVNGQTASQSYALMLTQLGDTVSGVSNENTTQQASLTQLTTQQSSLSSVSLDQEAANLTLYERSYEAASKVFTIVDELMASALNLGEETTVT